MANLIFLLAAIDFVKDESGRTVVVVIVLVIDVLQQVEVLAILIVHIGILAHESELDAVFKVIQVAQVGNLELHRSRFVATLDNRGGLELNCVVEHGDHTHDVEGFFLNLGGHGNVELVERRHAVLAVRDREVLAIQVANGSTLDDGIGVLVLDSHIGHGQLGGRHFNQILRLIGSEVGRIGNLNLAIVVRLHASPVGNQNSALLKERQVVVVDHGHASGVGDEQVTLVAGVLVSHIGMTGESEGRIVVQSEELLDRRHAVLNHGARLVATTLIIGGDGHFVEIELTSLVVVSTVVATSGSGNGNSDFLRTSRPGHGFVTICLLGDLTHRGCHGAQALQALSRDVEHDFRDSITRRGDLVGVADIQTQVLTAAVIVSEDRIVCARTFVSLKRERRLNCLGDSVARSRIQFAGLNHHFGCIAHAREKRHQQ